MRIKVKIFSGGIKEENLDVSPDSSYEELLLSLHINPEMVLVFRSGISVPLDEKVSMEDIEVLRVVSGG